MRVAEDGGFQKQWVDGSSGKVFVTKTKCVFAYQSEISRVSNCPYLHKLLEGRFEGNVVEGVSCLERLVSLMMHHRRRQRIEGDEVRDLTCFQT